jgi:hypothetical protein
VFIFLKSLASRLDFKGDELAADLSAPRWYQQASGPDPMFFPAAKQTFA